MFFVWPIVAAAVLGIYCGAWVRLLQFTIIVLIGAIGCMLSMWLGGHSPVWIPIQLFATMTALQAGYLVGLVSLTNRRRPPSNTRPIEAAVVQKAAQQ